MKLTKNRVIFIAFTCLFTLSLYYAYASVAATSFKYFGYGDGSPTFFHIFSIVFFILVPTLLIPVSNPRPSVYVVTIIFYVVYIPTLVILNDVGLAYNVEDFVLSLVLFVCFSINALFTRLPLFDIRKISILGIPTISIVYALAVPLSILIFYKVGWNFSFVSLLDVYSKRDAIKEMGLGSFGYFISWMANFFLPVIMARALVLGNWKVVLAVVMGYSFLYFTIGAKIYIFSLGYFVLSYGYYKTLKNGNYFIPLVFSVLLLLPLLMFGESLKELKFVYEGVISLRVFLIQGLSLAVYSDFFLGNQYTYFSHITGVNLFVDYPYSESIPMVLDTKYGLGTFNAPYYASDGFTSFGYLGMLIMAPLFSAFFYFFDLVSRKHNEKFVLLSISVFVVSLSNAALATSMISFGGVLLVIYFMFSVDKRMRIKEGCK
ncbi:hypothetical protein [Alishewanella jeotgali]|uniref:Putative B-band O-antigen polymerase n=1 Tax=Alishewanella jeotgali KCTC 22429 TaxID=1129374 RepID=H3ZAY4_9ALTE|nr:hypothetical protein [Alishewanella jeotgali]EHR42098.1 putative B-band O-antigen polymerase [Alishewanella jeotgali KCTC 22429]